MTYVSARSASDVGNGARVKRSPTSASLVQKPRQAVAASGPSSVIRASFQFPLVAARTRSWNCCTPFSWRGLSESAAVDAGGEVALHRLDHAAVLFQHRVGERDHVGDVGRVRVDEEVAVPAPCTTRDRSARSPRCSSSRRRCSSRGSASGTAIDRRRGIASDRATARSAGSSGRRGRRDTAWRRTADSAPDARAGCGSPRDSCRRRSSSCTRGRAAPNGRASWLRAGSRASRRRSLRGPRRAARRAASRFTNTCPRHTATCIACSANSSGSSVSPKSRAERRRPSNEYAHPWYWHTRFAHAPAPSSTSGPARCRQTL